MRHVNRPRCAMADLAAVVVKLVTIVVLVLCLRQCRNTAAATARCILYHRNLLDYGLSFLSASRDSASIVNGHS